MVEAGATDTVAPGGAVARSDARLETHVVRVAEWAQRQSWGAGTSAVTHQSTPQHAPTWRNLVPVLGEEGVHVLATGLQLGQRNNRQSGCVQRMHGMAKCCLPLRIGQARCITLTDGHLPTGMTSGQIPQVNTTTYTCAHLKHIHLMRKSIPPPGCANPLTCMTPRRVRSASLNSTVPPMALRREDEGQGRTLCSTSVIGP